MASQAIRSVASLWETASRQQPFWIVISTRHRQSRAAKLLAWRESAPPRKRCCGCAAALEMMAFAGGGDRMLASAPHPRTWARVYGIAARRFGMTRVSPACGEAR
jgi:hypothetical protein